MNDNEEGLQREPALQGSQQPVALWVRRKMANTTAEIRTGRGVKNRHPHMMIFQPQLGYTLRGNVMRIIFLSHMDNLQAAHKP